MADVILHAFNWTYAKIAEAAPEIARRGFGAVLLPPPLYSDENGPEWWQRYQPRDYRVIRSALGNRQQLATALSALHQAGVRAYADVVFNHMANEFGVRDDALDFPGRALQQRYADEASEFAADRLYGNLAEPLFDERSFHPKAGIFDWLDSGEVAHGWLGGLPDLSLTVWVVKQQIACLEALNQLGFDGYRVDAIKHLAEQHIDLVFRHPVLDGKFVFGEILTFNDDENDRFLWPIVRDSPLSFYDFPLQQTLRRAFAPGGSLQLLVGAARHGRALPWNRGVTFSITHDVPLNDGFRGMLLDPRDETLANAYLLARDGGVPMLYSDHGESVARYPADAGRWSELWRRPDVTAMLAFHNAVHGTPEQIVHAADDCLLLARGDFGLLAINKSGNWQAVPLATGTLRPGTYECLLHGHRMLLDGALTLHIPPREAQLWLREE